MLRNKVDGEIVIADKGSTDGSQELAEHLGARVEAISQKGYGLAISGGVKAARGQYCIIGDDDSYNFNELGIFCQLFGMVQTW